MHPVVIAVYLRSNMQQHSNSSIGGLRRECNWALVEHACWKGDANRKLRRGEETAIKLFVQRSFLRLDVKKRNVSRRRNLRCEQRRQVPRIIRGREIRDECAPRRFW